MGTRIVVIALLNFFVFHCHAQYIVNDANELLDLKKLPQEKAYIDHTGPLLFSGEYLYYNFYGINAQNYKLTDISKIGYVALVDESKNYIFEHKLKLDKGQGYGDFFITTNIPSGKYKLLGYTQWMKNSGLSQVFKDDIVIVNPYLVDQFELLRETKSTTDTIAPSSLMQSVLDTATISITTDKKRYRTRDKVNLSIRNFKGPLGHGTYTIKVKRKEGIPVSDAMNAVSYATAYFNADKQIKQRIGDSIFLPEQRGELFYGTITDSLTGAPAKDLPVVISIPGKEFLLKYAQTNKNGTFYTYLRKDYKNPVAVVQINEQGNSYTIAQGIVPKLDLSELDFSDFRLQEAYGEYIKKRSILNQLENQFFTLKPDSILDGTPIDPFDGAMPEVVVLDDYTRFPTLEETLVEVVKFAGYRRGENGNGYIRVAQDFETYNEQFNDFPAIILMDGVYIPDHGEVRKFDARSIEKIRLTRDQFRLGNKDYQGIVSVETFDGDFLEGYTGENNLLVPLNQPISKKNYFVQTYNTEDSRFSRIPDYRSLLLWEPSISIDGNSYNLEFFTSDREGDYEIMLNGFTSNGKPITVTRTISVWSDDIN